MNAQNEGTSVPAARHPLDSPRGKLVRAVQQAKALLAHCDAYVEEEPLRLFCQFEHGAQLAYLQGRPPPMYLGLILGEVVHDLRSALDQLAWRLALEHCEPEVLERREVWSAITFPIAHSREAFTSHRAIRYFSHAAIARMEPLQPFQNVGLEQVNPLALLQDLSNADKHRALVPALGQIDIAEFELASDTALGADAVELLAPEASLVDPTTPILRIRAPASARIEFAPVPLHICFPTYVTGEPDIFYPRQIEDLCRHITEAVHAFESLFPPVDWEERVASWITPNLPR